MKLEFFARHSADVDCVFQFLQMLADMTAIQGNKSHANVKKAYCKTQWNVTLL